MTWWTFYSNAWRGLKRLNMSGRGDWVCMLGRVSWRSPETCRRKESMILFVNKSFTKDDVGRNNVRLSTLNVTMRYHCRPDRHSEIRYDQTHDWSCRWGHARKQDGKTRSNFESKVQLASRRFITMEDCSGLSDKAIKEELFQRLEAAITKTKSKTKVPSCHGRYA